MYLQGEPGLPGGRGLPVSKGFYIISISRSILWITFCLNSEKAGDKPSSRIPEGVSSHFKINEFGQKKGCYLEISTQQILFLSLFLAFVTQLSEAAFKRKIQIFNSRKPFFWLLTLILATRESKGILWGFLTALSLKCASGIL